jgi:pimeloyl-ACP methyl ester carboxylesterase
MDIISNFLDYKVHHFLTLAKGSEIKPRDKVVYLQHGLQDSSDTWIVNKEENAPGFILANKGYDVWVGNTRGNRYSSPDLNPNIRDFWNFTFDEMTSYDLPAAFTYIAKETGKKVHYIGHSQGNLIMLAALSQHLSEI